MDAQLNYVIPYKTSSVESLFALATRVVALHVANNLKIAQFLPSNVKSVLITLLGRRGALTGPVLRSLAHRDLQVVNLSGSLVRDSTVKILQYLTKLKSLYIPSHKISTMVLVELFPCLPFLEDLDTSSSEQVNDQVLVSLGNSCPLLRLVNLGKCPSFTDAGLAHLVACLYSLTVLDISHSQVTDNGLKALSHSPSKRTLRELHIDGCRRLTPACGESLQMFPCLSMLSFYDCPCLSSSDWFLSFSSNDKRLFKNISFTIE